MKDHLFQQRREYKNLILQLMIGKVIKGTKIKIFDEYKKTLKSFGFIIMKTDN